MKYIVNLKTEELEWFATWRISYVSCEGNNRWYDKEVPDSWNHEQVRESIQIGGCGDDVAELLDVELISRPHRADKIPKFIEAADKSKDEFMESVKDYPNIEVNLHKGGIFSVVFIETTPENIENIKKNPLVKAVEEDGIIELVE